jgi:hypothetical protein
MPHKDRIEKNAYHRAYYAGHRDVLNGRMAVANKRRRHDRYAEVQRLKSEPCTDCRRAFPYYVMDFDHRDPAFKTDDVASMVKRMFTWETVLNEIAKCDLVCANCHRLRTYHGSNSYKTRRFEQHKAILDELKSTTPCLDCGGYFKPCQMDFDHTGVEAKVSNVARLVGGPTNVLVSELRKCHLVCANCHRSRGFTKVRPEAPCYGDLLIQRFREIETRIPTPTDQRFVPFPHPELLGVVPDKELAMKTGISREMVAWYRRKAGVVLNRRGERAA